MPGAIGEAKEDAAEIRKTVLVAADAKRLVQIGPLIK